LNFNYPKEKRPYIVELNINAKKLEGFLNLEGFIKLKKLHCNGNKLTGLDLSMCPNLTHLECSYNELVKLNLKGCRELTRLSCYTTPLNKIDFLLDLPNPNKLIFLDIGDNNFSPHDLVFLKPFTNLKSLSL
jgi:Leucine Rich repeats (2 copies)